MLIGHPDNAVVFDFKPGIDAGAQMLGRRGEDQRFSEIAHGRPPSPRDRRGDARPRRGRDPRRRGPSLRRGARSSDSTSATTTEDGRGVTRAAVTGAAARRGQGRFVLADHRRRRHRPRPGPRRWSTAWPAYAAGSRPRPGLLGRHRRRPVAAGVQAPSPRPRPPAGGRVGGAGAAGAPLHRGVRPARPGHRPGAAHPRRRDPAQPLPQRPAHLRQAARARRGPDRQRERHRGHLRDPVRRQRPARRAGGAPGARRPAGAALRRRRAVRRPARATRRAG